MVEAPDRRSSCTDAVAYQSLAELARLGAGAPSPSLLAEEALNVVLRAAGASSGAITVDGGRRVLYERWQPSPDSLPVRVRAPLVVGGVPFGAVECAAPAGHAFDESVQRFLDAAGALLGPLVDHASSDRAQHALELRTLHRTAETVARTLELDQVLGHCLDLAMQVTQAPAGAIYLRDAQRMVYGRFELRNVPESVAPIDVAAGPIDAALAGGFTIHVVDTDATSPDPLLAAAARHGFARILLIPLRVEERIVGLLGLDFFSPITLAPSTMLTLEAIARQEAIAVENARVHHQLELRARTALVLRQFAERALGPLDETQLYPIILETALALSRGDRALIARLTPDGQQVRIEAGTGKDERLVGVAMPVESNELRDVGAPIVVEDTTVLPPDSMFGRVVRQHQTASYCLFVMRYQGRPVGRLFAGSGEPRRYHPAEIEALQLLAAMAGEALARAQAQREVEAQRRRLDQIIEHVPIVIAVLDRAGRVVHQNRASREFGALFDPMVGENDWKASLPRMHMTLPDGRPIEEGELSLARAFAGEHPAPQEIVLITPDGKRRMHVMAVAAPLDPRGGPVNEIVTAFHDVSALRELADAKDRFLRVASHELRSPITSLRATTSLLEMDPSAIVDPQRRSTMLQRIQRQIDRLIKLVEQLLDSARLNASELPLERTECDLVALARDAIEQAGDAERVQLEAPPSLLGWWDPLRIEQALTNLVGNALKYSPPSSPVLLRIGEGDPVKIEVIDRGIGIAPEQLDQVFTPFFRAANAQHQHKGGLGLGLHITAEIVRRHGGRIRLASELERGSTFTVELPRR